MANPIAPSCHQKLDRARPGETTNTLGLTCDHTPAIISQSKTSGAQAPSASTRHAFFQLTAQSHQASQNSSGNQTNPSRKTSTIRRKTTVTNSLSVCKRSVTMACLSCRFAKPWRGGGQNSDAMCGISLKARYFPKQATSTFGGVGRRLRPLRGRALTTTNSGSNRPGANSCDPYRGQTTFIPEGWQQLAGG
jgi:hypothetical protein